ncbi:cytochrome oxidase assembly factor 4 [Monosporozyma unispora]|nr:Cytochrome oxidase assembly factor 4 [Kazachstania unispora]
MSQSDNNKSTTPQDKKGYVPNTTSKYYQEALEEYKDLLEDTDPEDWDKRIQSTGCYVENMALQLCHAETGDWRQCFKEMEMFRQCWDTKGNNKRTHTVDKQ